MHMTKTGRTIAVLSLKSFLCANSGGGANQFSEQKIWNKILLFKQFV